MILMAAPIMAKTILFILSFTSFLFGIFGKLSVVLSVVLDNGDYDACDCADNGSNNIFHKFSPPFVKKSYNRLSAASALGNSERYAYGSSDDRGNDFVHKLSPPLCLAFSESFQSSFRSFSTMAITMLATAPITAAIIFFITFTSY